MSFIALTECEPYVHKPVRTVYVRPDHIIRIAAVEKNLYTTISVTGGDLDVVETPEEILRRINGATVNR